MCLHLNGLPLLVIPIYLLSTDFNVFHKRKRLIFRSKLTLEVKVVTI